MSLPLVAHGVALSVANTVKSSRLQQKRGPQSQVSQRTGVSLLLIRKVSRLDRNESAGSNARLPF